MPLGQKGDWVVMAAWLVQLRSRLLLPADAPAQQAAAAEADQLRDRLMTLQAMQGAGRLAGAGRSWVMTCLRAASPRCSAFRPTPAGDRCHRLPLGQPGAVR